MTKIDFDTIRKLCKRFKDKAFGVSPTKFNK